MAKNTDTPDEDVTNLSSKRAKKEAYDAFIADIEASCEPDWKEIEMPEWKGRKVWVRSLTAGERSMVLNRGYTQGTDENGQPYSKPNGKLQSLIAEVATYWENGGDRVRVFNDGNKHLIQKLKGPILDRLVTPVLELSGLTKSAADKAKDDFLEAEKNSSDSDSLETWDGQ